MAVTCDKTGRWRWQDRVKLPNGKLERISGSCPPLDNTKTRAKRDLELARAQLLNPTPVQLAATTAVEPKRKDVPTVEKFSETFVEVSELDNKGSSIDSKNQILKSHVKPELGKLRLDEVTYAKVEDFKLALKRKELGNKTINNCLTVLRRMLVVARKRGLIESTPEVEWLTVAPQDFDFLTFEEAERLVAGADAEWKTMIVVGLRCGLRQSELIGLRWEDVDLVKGELKIRQAIVRGRVGTPKSGKPREVPLSDQALTALKHERHLRGPYVFSNPDGKPWKKGELKWVTWRAAKRAGLRRLGWHVLRHTFASHLVMRNVPLKVVQELMGHSTIQMTMRYSHLSPESKGRSVVNLLDQPSVAQILPKQSEQGAK